MGRKPGRQRKKTTPPATQREPKAGREKRQRTWLAAAALLAALAGVALLWRGRAQVQREAGLDVLLVSIDTLRADAVGAYGRKDAETHWIDRLAADGVRFSEARAHNVVTLPSHTNMLTGQLPLEHGIRDNSGFRVPKDLPTLAVLLKAQGYHTGAFVSAFVLDSRFGLDRGFDSYDDRFGGGEMRTEFLVPERHGPETVAAARDWLAHQTDGKPRFAFVHLYEPHFPYEPPEPFKTRFAADPYHGEVAAADAALGPLLEPLLQQGASGHTLVVLTSDHGESLGEHGELTHGIFGYEATLHVPLVVYAPRLLRPRVVTTPVGHVDLLPTVLDALGLPVPEGVSGRSLWPLASGVRDSGLPHYFESLSSTLNRGWAPLYGVIEGELKYVDLPQPELYDLAQDPHETRNLAALRPEDLERLRTRLARLRTRDRGISRVSEEAATLDRLRALGYVAGGGAEIREKYTDADDPKNLVEFDTRIREVVTLYRDGRLDEAIRLCERNIADRPEMPVSYLHLAYMRRAQGDLAAAVAAARRSFELRPLDGEAVSLYATYLTEAGQAAEAVHITAPYMEQFEPDLDVITARGMAQARLGEWDAALATFAKGHAADPTNAANEANVGTVYLMRGSLDEAKTRFERTLAIDPGFAKAHNSLGVVAMREGRPGEAVEHWRRAFELDPRDYQTAFNLATTLVRTGREAEARPYFEAYLREAPPALEARDMERVRAFLASRS